MKERVLVGLSGGIDSWMTALLLQKQGYEVIGLNLSLWHDKTNEGLQELCSRAEIPLWRYDGRKVFREKVVAFFVQEYRQGRTPNPCTVCNTVVKWELLRRAADESGIKKIATGHYVRIRKQGNHFYIFKGKDPVKDQSYFLWGIEEEILARTLTPLGDYTKAEVRRLAVAEGYGELAHRKESMGICFLEGTDYREFVAAQADAEGSREGWIRDRRGEIVGQHSGLLNYTVGQKRGMPVVEGGQLYVAEIRPGKNEIFADTKENLFRTRLEIDRVHVIEEKDLEERGIEVKVRGLGQNPLGEVRISREENGKLVLHLSSPAWAPAPGQPVALYQRERLLGGGILVTCPGR